MEDMTASDEPCVRKVDGVLHLFGCLETGAETVVRAGRYYGSGNSTRLVMLIEEHDDPGVGYHTHVYFKWPNGQRGKCTGAAFFDWLDGLVRGRDEDEQARWNDCGEESNADD